MYINSSFPKDQYYTSAQQKQHWLDEAEDCLRKGFHIMAEACHAIAANIVL